MDCSADVVRRPAMLTVAEKSKRGPLGRVFVLSTWWVLHHSIPIGIGDSADRNRLKSRINDAKMTREPGVTLTAPNPIRLSA